MTAIAVAATLLLFCGILAVAFLWRDEPERKCPCERHGTPGGEPCSSHRWSSFPHGDPCAACGKGTHDRFWFNGADMDKAPARIREIAYRYVSESSEAPGESEMQELVDYCKRNREPV